MSRKIRRLRKTKKLVGVVIISVALLCTAGVTGGAKETLTIWQPAATDLLGGMLPAINQFEANNPDIQIKVELMTGNWGDKITIAFAGKTEPDIVHFYQMRPYLKAGLVAPIATGGTISVADLERNFYEATLKDTSWKGVYYGLPSTYNLNAALLCNKEFFKEAGVAVSLSSYNELIEAAQKLTKTDAGGKITRSGLKSYRGTWSNHIYFERFLLQLGGEIIDEGGFGVAVFDSPEGLQALQHYSDLFDKYKVDDVLFGMESVIQNFGNGLAAMVYGGPWISSYVDLEYPGVSWAYTSFPALPGTELPLHSITPTWAHYVTAKAADKKSPWKLMKHFAEPDVVAAYDLGWGTIPARIDVASRPEFTENAQFAENIAAAKYGRWVGNDRSGEYQKILNDMVDKVLYHTATLEEALSTAEKEMNEMFAIHDKE